MRGEVPRIISYCRAKAQARTASLFSGHRQPGSKTRHCQICGVRAWDWESLWACGQSRAFQGVMQRAKYSSFISRHRSSGGVLSAATIAARVSNCPRKLRVAESKNEPHVDAPPARRLRLNLMPGLGMRRGDYQSPAARISRPSTLGEQGRGDCRKNGSRACCESLDLHAGKLASNSGGKCCPNYSADCRGLSRNLRLPKEVPQNASRP